MSEPPKTLVLVIDDEPQIRRLLTVTLEANAYDVLCANTGKEGLVLAAQHRPSIVILHKSVRSLRKLSVGCLNRKGAKNAEIALLFSFSAFIAPLRFSSPALFGCGSAALCSSVVKSSSFVGPVSVRGRSMVLQGAGSRRITEGRGKKSRRRC
jgi:hypothetical protein